MMGKIKIIIYIIYIYIYILYKYIKRLLWKSCYVLKSNIYVLCIVVLLYMAYGQPYTGILSVFWSSLHINSKRNFLINEVNRNILLTLGKKNQTRFYN